MVLQPDPMSMAQKMQNAIIKTWTVQPTTVGGTTGTYPLMDGWEMYEPMKTKQHMDFAAKVIKNINDLSARRQAAVVFADEFQKENPRFDRKRFQEACDLMVSI